ncbi:MAG: hypothetical protein ACE361_00920 [Aureliella sp.]
MSKQPSHFKGEATLSCPRRMKWFSLDEPQALKGFPDRKYFSVRGWIPDDDPGGHAAIVKVVEGFLSSLPEEAEAILRSLTNPTEPKRYQSELPGYDACDFKINDREENKPSLVGLDKKPLDASEFYDGCWARILYVPEGGLKPSPYFRLKPVACVKVKDDFRISDGNIDVGDTLDKLLPDEDDDTVDPFAA